MVHIKKLVMHGFKSFGKKTEVFFDRGINVVVGPNGSGKSNISDALCFALGRLSVKSMRAAKTQNMIFMGSKFVKPAHEASVELLFDNSDRGFSVEKDEVCLKRIIRRNGQGVYKINDETKTRGEILELLAQAGIDPYGFNLVLQGQIQSIVKMHPEERRKIIEEVAGISIYETRKEKSLKELEKTDDKLKEINTTLRERRAFLNNLEKERAQALKFREIENTIKRAKASILSKRIEEKQKELDSILKSVEEKNKQKDKLKERAERAQAEISELSEKINQINKHIQQATGLEQEALHSQIANLKAEIEGLKVRHENYENRKAEIERRIEEMTKSIPEAEKEIESLKKKSPQMAKKAEEIKKKKEELAQIEEERRKLLAGKTELNLLRERTKEKERELARAAAEAEAAVKHLEEFSADLIYKNEEECSRVIASFAGAIEARMNEIDKIGKSEIEKEKEISVSESEAKRNGKIKADVASIDVCPLCQSKITEEHKNRVVSDADRRIAESEGCAEKLKGELAIMRETKSRLVKEIKCDEEKISLARMELMKHRAMKDKKAQIKKFVDEEKAFRDELKRLEERRKGFESRADDFSAIEDKYQTKMHEIEEISSRTEEDIDTTILYKERELERTSNVIKSSKKDFEELEETARETLEAIDNKLEALGKKEEQEKELNEKFQKMYEEMDKMQKGVQEKSLSHTELQNEARQIDEQVNYLMIGKARLDAEREALHMEISEFAGIELMKMGMAMLEERLQKAQESLREIGSINQRALEVYEGVKKEYDIVQEKANVLEREKEEIMKIIEEIDRKKTRTFMRTFNAINNLFTTNFAKLSSKGVAFLDIENKEDIFSGGVDIIVKLAKGKYFDVTSLSGGEQTLVALSLLFAIQEHKPYHFYVFDEIDAALDKRNSERLAGLLTQYMKSGQYIVITHNDAIITNSDILYGVSMHDGISKILSLNLDDNGEKAKADASGQASNTTLELQDDILEHAEPLNPAQNAESILKY